MLGGLTFAVWAAVAKEPASTSAGIAPPEPARAVVLTEATLDRLRDGYLRAWRRPPTAAELGDLALEWVSEEILYREARAKGLDRDDPSVRRRLIEKMTLLARPAVAPGEPTRAELERWFVWRRHRFRLPARFWFAHVFFDAERRRGRVNEDAAAALATLKRASPQPAGLGDPPPVRAVVEDATDTQVAHLFGESFAATLARLPVHEWQGPLSSKHGVHLVRLERRDPARDPALDEVEKTVRADWLTERNRGLLEAAAGLRARHHVEVPPVARKRLAGAPAMEDLLQGTP